MEPPRTDEQARAERLDTDHIDIDDYPPDQPLGVDELGTTADEERGGDSVRQREARRDHRRDLRAPDLPTAGLLDPDDEMGPDRTKELVGVEGEEPDAYSGEEAAMHEVELDAVDREVARPGLDAEAIDGRRS